MEIKQLTSYINSAFFTPWDYELETELQASADTKTIPMKQVRRQDRRSSVRHIKKEIQGGEPSIEEQAKKTLLNLQGEPREVKLQRLKEYIESKQHHNRLGSVLPFGANELKLPLLNRKKTLEYNSSLFLGRAGERSIIDERQIFKKYGEHRKAGHRDPTASRVERSSSFGPSAAKNVEALSEIRRKYETVQNKEQEESLEGLINIRLKGKKYQRNERASSMFREGLNELSYVPTQSKITPHAVLFGHSKDDVMRRVVRQIQHKIQQI